MGALSLISLAFREFLIKGSLLYKSSGTQSRDKQLTIQSLFISFTQRLKIGTEKIVHVGYAAFLFQTWAFMMNILRYQILLCILLLMICK